MTTQIEIGDLIKYSNPYPDEVNTTFKVLEVNGDRVLAEANISMSILPVYTILIKDIVKT